MQMNILCCMEDLKIHQYNSKLERHNKQIAKHKYEGEKVDEESNKLAGKVTVLTIKVKEL